MEGGYYFHKVTPEMGPAASTYFLIFDGNHYDVLVKKSTGDPIQALDNVDDGWETAHGYRATKASKKRRTTLQTTVSHQMLDNADKPQKPLEPSYGIFLVWATAKNTERTLGIAQIPKKYKLGLPLQWSCLIPTQFNPNPNPTLEEATLLMLKCPTWRLVSTLPWMRICRITVWRAMMNHWTRDRSDFRETCANGTSVQLVNGDGLRLPLYVCMYVCMHMYVHEHSNLFLDSPVLIAIVLPRVICRFEGAGGVYCE
ncbi:uncharacterized protein EV422DRAFT_433939 [Fimicolochytrium jonesii]|uniref:uncharacterized protein n=1 Tax=Fimicolochytrium jonesii TaxID=1396493 RepID=UPI0022FEA0E3|nr:uncharacterized protein EV422DRAFT_433939 [Fimicolochytrium jonesii]KAI8821820.1 hypothetical protein EV422DRAFT_433939 [Fimicolochytrium jonesii]